MSLSKLRRPRRRNKGSGRFTPEREILDWWDVLRTGYNFFGDLTPYGFTGDDAHEWPAQRQAAEDVWRRIGSNFLTVWRPEHPSETPWAWREYGPPRGWDGALPAFMPTEARRALKASLRLRATA